MWTMLCGRTGVTSLHVLRRYVLLRWSSNKQRHLPPPKTTYNRGLLVVPVITFCLGTWQVFRWRRKLSLIDQITERSVAPPVPLPSDLSELSGMEYCALKVRGTFDHARRVFVGPRTPVLRGAEVPLTGSALIAARSLTGFHVVTPFKLEDSGREILINRGWVSRSYLTGADNLPMEPRGVVDVVGLVRLTDPAQGVFYPPQTDSRKNVMFAFRDVDKMARYLSTDAVFLDERGSQMARPSASQTHITLRNNHVTYIITWYGLSVATAYMCYLAIIKPALRRRV